MLGKKSYFGRGLDLVFLFSEIAMNVLNPIRLTGNHVGGHHFSLAQASPNQMIAFFSGHRHTCFFIWVVISCE